MYILDEGLDTRNEHFLRNSCAMRTAERHELTIDIRNSSTFG
jgi:hypothetical protein